MLHRYSPRLPCAAQEFLRGFKEVRNCVAACNQPGLFKSLEAQQAELEVCEKALADFKESKRRAFPRFYFVSSNDLLDILSNGACHGLSVGTACRFVVSCVSWRASHCGLLAGMMCASWYCGLKP